MQNTVNSQITASPVLLVGLAVALFILVVLLIVVIESAVLQWMRWGELRRSLTASFWMNAASSLVGLVFLVLVPSFGRWLLIIGWALAVIIEALVLMRLKPGAVRQNWLVSTIANLVSYLVLILPATMMAG
jgi:hypothetical protein